MSGERITFDTNVFFYAVDDNAGWKTERALYVIERTDPRRSFVVLQTLGELCFSVGRKKPELLPTAHRVVRDVMAFFDITAAGRHDLTEALVAQQEHGLPFWDAMLWATARRAGCSLLLTEDLQDGRVLGGVTFRNPFTMSLPELEALLS